MDWRAHPYDERLIQILEAIRPGLAHQLDTAPSLDDSQTAQLLEALLECACSAQNSRNINLGRDGLVALPRAWLLARIEAAAEPYVQCNDDWEYRRLLEVYAQLDPVLVQRLVQRGLDHPNPEIREAAEDFRT